MYYIFKYIHNIFLQKEVRCIVIKIHILGGSGSGKTYLAKKLSADLQIPIFDLDMVFWSGNFSQKKEESIRNQELMELSNKHDWVIEGVYYDWVDPSLAKADWIIWLDVRTHIRQRRVLTRYIKRVIGILPSKNESLKSIYNLLKWNFKYDEKNHLKIQNKLNKYRKKLIIFNRLSKKEYDSLLNQLKSHK